MMGDTGPCGPCSEVHVDLTPDGDTRGALVNKGDPRCIEIWNLVFIQFNAQPVAGGGDPGQTEYVPLAARHVDTGMGFERAVAIIQGTRNLTDFSGTTSNYETDVFRPIFDELEKLSGKKYAQHAACNAGVPAWQVEQAILPFEMNRKRSTSLFASSPITSARSRSRLLTESFHQTKAAVTFCVAFFVVQFATDARSVFTSRSFSDSLTSWRRRWAMSFPKSGRNSQKSKKQFAAKKKPLTKHSTEASSYLSAKSRVFWGARALARSVTRLAGHSCTKAPRRTYYKRRLPHFERPQAKYMVTFTTRDIGTFSRERDITLETILHDSTENTSSTPRASCLIMFIMLLEPQIESQDAQGKPCFYVARRILHSKSVSSQRINKLAGMKGQRVWENESFDRVIRSEHDLEEKFHYICRNPWDSGVAKRDGDYLVVIDAAADECRESDTAGEAPGSRTSVISATSLSNFTILTAFRSISRN